jgi:tetratricopeptide (TPR) repeat protein
LGVLLSDLRDVDAAIGMFRRAIDINPRFSEAHYQIGLLLYVEKGAMDEALEEVERALELDPTDPSARLIMGELLFEKKTPPEREKGTGAKKATRRT